MRRTRRAPAAADQAAASGDPSATASPTGDRVPAARARLSVVRIAVALVVVAATATGTGTLAMRALHRNHRAGVRWFAPYVDVTLTPSFDFQDAAANPNLDVVLAFVVGSATHRCQPTWGGYEGLDAAAAHLDLDRRIVRLRERGGDVVVSFGGAANQELAVSCTDPVALANAYRSVIDRYRLSVIDLDLEGAGLDPAAVARRAAAIAQVQARTRGHGGRLDVWLTVPVAPDGLPAGAIAAVRAMLRAKVDVTGVNLMTMDYGGSRPADQDMVAASLAAVDAAAGQVTTAYREVGVTLSPPQAYAKLGVTPMIGQNDVRADRLDPASARRLFDQASRRGVTRFSMWSLNRDVSCGANVDPAIADDRCSGVDQEPREFSSIFSRIRGSATPGAATPDPAVDGGRASGSGSTARAVGTVGASTPGPYAAWRPRREYDTNARVAWHGMVYEAKWWTKGASPDAQAVHEWDSPWRSVGPILAHDVPLAPASTLPAHTYPGWRLTQTYLPGDRVMAKGVGYRAKWWNRGDDPAADVDNTWQSPWEPVGPPADPSTAAPSAPRAPG
ncbi:MAG: glycosyl hydrolase family 18 [Acidimicrobiales bacterium]|nr:glycosyl hydrolase family 18 [Acidimicrobiales bacterium]